MFPKTNLPLNIFENRYIDMIDYSMSTNRLIGMVQHKPNNELYNIGCYGKITVFNETTDNRYLVNLEGRRCFRIIKEVKGGYKFRVCEVEDIDSFNKNDLSDVQKNKVLSSFQKYNDYKNIGLGLDEISKLNLLDLLKLIVMVSPFGVSVKQMFLELKTNEELYENVLSALEIELASKEKIRTIN